MRTVKVVISVFDVVSEDGEDNLSCDHWEEIWSSRLSNEEIVQIIKENRQDVSY